MPTPRSGTGRSSQFTDGVSVIFTFAGTISTDQNGNIPQYFARQRTPLTRFWVNVITAPVGGDVDVGFYVNGILVATVTLLDGEFEAFEDQNVTLEEGDKLSVQIDSMATTTAPTTMTMQAV